MLFFGCSAVFFFSFLLPFNSRHVPRSGLFLLALSSLAHPFSTSVSHFKSANAMNKLTVEGWKWSSSFCFSCGCFFLTLAVSWVKFDSTVAKGSTVHSVSFRFFISRRLSWLSRDSFSSSQDADFACYTQLGLLETSWTRVTLLVKLLEGKRINIHPSSGICVKFTTKYT